VSGGKREVVTNAGRISRMGAEGVVESSEDDRVLFRGEDGGVRGRNGSA